MTGMTRLRHSHFKLQYFSTRRELFRPGKIKVREGLDVKRREGYACRAYSQPTYLDPLSPHVQTAVG